MDFTCNLNICPEIQIYNKDNLWKFVTASHPCSIFTLTGGGGASGTLWGNPGPLAGAPTSDMSGILEKKYSYE